MNKLKLKDFTLLILASAIGGTISHMINYLDIIKPTGVTFLDVLINMIIWATILTVVVYAFINTLKITFKGYSVIFDYIKNYRK